ncbi:hypothetical protein ACIQVT_00390 [Streptomyces sp. NPDC100445]|uniref:hypothetical protein n=1 Tax=Streptomyces sp. NPDC100445 TaxID=3366102 RepID=UPI00382A0E32
MPEPDIQLSPASVPEPDPEAEPDPEPAALSVRERLRRAGWAHAITVSGAGLAAVAAIGGLWAQAVATYWTQQTARDQLSQSREDSQREEQAQASQVTFWVQDSKSGGGPELHVLNRSLDPVTSVRLGARRFAVGSYYGFPGGHDLPPCTEEVFDTQKMFLVPSLDQVTRKGQERFTSARAAFTYLGFVDSHGRRWGRLKTDLVDMSDSEILIDPETTLTDARGKVVLGEPVVKTADNCGNDHG